MFSSELKQGIIRGCLDKSFRIKWHSDFDNINRQLNIPNGEIGVAREFLVAIMDTYGSENANKKNKEDLVKELKESSTSSDAYKLLSSSIELSKLTFKHVSIMSYAIFALGIILFGLSAISGLFYNDTRDTLPLGHWEQLVL